MGYDRSVFDRVTRELEQRRARALFTREQRMAEAYEACPTLREIDAELQRCGAVATEMILSHPEDAAKLSAQLAQQLERLVGQRAAALEAAGYAADYTDVKYECAACSDTGYIGGRQCDCLRRALAEESCRASSLSGLFDTQNFERFDFNRYSAQADTKEGISPRECIRGIYRVCREFVDGFDSPGKSLFFYGGAGLGKTFLSTAIAKELLARGKSVIYQSAAKLFALYMDYSFGRVDAAAAKRQLDSFEACDLLIIDDLGTEAVSTYSVSFLFELLNERILRGKKMVVSTNLNVGEIASTYSERIHSRLLEHFELLKFVGEDIRLQKMMEL